MLFRVFLFEIRYRLRHVSTHLFLAVLFWLPYLATMGASSRISSVGRIGYPNSAYYTALLVTAFTALGALVVSALVGTAVYRDFEHRVHELFFTTRLSKWSYLGGRFLGSFAVAVLIFSGMIFGIIAGATLPASGEEYRVPFRLDVYLQAFFLFLLPNLFLLSALFFVLGALTRSLLAIYAQGVVLLVFYFLSLALASSFENLWLSSLMDPIGMMAMRAETRYWTVTEQAYHLIPVTGYLFWNRLLWGGVAAGILAFGYRRFRFSTQPLAGVWRRPVRLDPGLPTLDRAAPEPLSFPNVQPRFDLAAQARQLLVLVRVYFLQIIRSVPFLVIVGSGMVLLVAV
ncbi:MAG TPA: ABC transporter permease, partial [Armatimonadota bacterium]|nr:ABC transporter permease [Armatimonadota bacterium]